MSPSGLSADELTKILNRTPAEMRSHYLESVGRIAREHKDQYCFVLGWVACSVRILNPKEIMSALALVMRKSVWVIFNEIEISYTDLVYVAEDATVHIVHSTVRETIFDTNSSEFAIDAYGAHSRMTFICLEILMSDNDKLPPNSETLEIGKNKANLIDYARTSFSEHLLRSDPDNDEALPILVRFLKSDGLTWLNLMLQNHDLEGLVRTGKNLRHYAELRRKHEFSLQDELQVVDAWAADLIRLFVRSRHQSQTSLFIYRGFTLPKGGRRYTSSTKEN